MYAIVLTTLFTAQYLAAVNNTAVRFGPRVGARFSFTHTFAPEFGSYVACTGRGFYAEPLWDLACLTSNGTNFREERWVIYPNDTAARLPSYYFVQSHLPGPGLSPGEDLSYFAVGGYSTYYLDSGGLPQELHSRVSALHVRRRPSAGAEPREARDRGLAQPQLRPELHGCGGEPGPARPLQRDDRRSRRPRRVRAALNRALAPGGSGGGGALRRGGAGGRL